MSTSSAHLSHYTEILRRVRQAGLLDKDPGFYIKRLIAITLITAMLWATLVWISFNAVWLAFPLAALLGIMSAQYGFIAHESAHRQVFRNNRLNDWAGRILANLFAGLSYGFWMKKHNRHHAKPNQINADPDIAIRVLSFTTESLEAKSGPEKVVSKNQGWLFPFLLLFTGFDLLLDSLVAVTRKETKHRLFEFTLMLIRQITPFALFFALFGLPIAIGLWIIQMMAFGFFMGGAFAPNHKGMPLVAEDAKIDFFERQVLTSRNIRSTWLTDNLMGGLNFQIEHHLFPSMARPHLKQAGQITRQYCDEKNIHFTETGLFASYGEIIRYLNKVGLSSNSDPFVCPMVAQLRPRY